MIINLILIILFVISLWWYGRVQLGNKMRAFLIGTDDPILDQPRFNYLKIHVNRITPEYAVILRKDPFNLTLWDKQFMDAADNYWSDKLDLTPEQFKSLREKKGYYKEDGTWVAAPISSNGNSSDSSRSDSDFGGGGGFDGGGAGGDY